MKGILQNFKEKCKQWGEVHEPELFLIAVLVLVSSIVLGAGRLWLIGSHRVQPRLSGGQAHKIVIEENAFPVPLPRQDAEQARFLASINGERYYPAGCKVANRIKEENRVWFFSEDEASGMGYTPSTQC